MSNTIAECANCDWTGAYSETDEIDNLWERCEPGEPIPHGQCPECGALCYEPEKAKPLPPAQLPENKGAIWILNSAIPDGNTIRPISALEVFTDEAEARAAYDKTMRDEWEYNAPCNDDGDPLPYPGDPDAAHEAIVQDKERFDVDEPWGQWTLTRHEIAAPPAQSPPPDAMAALRAVKDWHTRAPIAEIETVEASIGENFPQALVDAALASPPPVQSPAAMALVEQIARMACSNDTYGRGNDAPNYQHDAGDAIDSLDYIIGRARKICGVAEHRVWEE